MAPETADLPSFALRGTASAAITYRHAEDRLALRRAILHGEGRPRRPHALDEKLLHDQDPIETGDPYPYLIPDTHGMGCLRGIPTHAHVAGPARRSGCRSRLVDAHGPQPRVEAHGGITHGSILP